MEQILIPAWPDGATAIGVGRTTMFELIADGRIASVKVGRKRLVEPAELRRFARSLTMVGAA